MVSLGHRLEGAAAAVRGSFSLVASARSVGSL